MPDQLQLRGGTTVQHSTFTGVSKEVTVDTTKKTAVVHDGSTVGGNPLLREDASNSALALASAGTPSLKFSGDSNTGVFSPGADQLAITTGGTSRLAVSTTAVSSTLPVDVPLGAVGTPSLTFTGDLNTGIWSPAADTIAFSEGGAEAMRIDSSSRLLVGTSSSLRSAGIIQVAGSSYPAVDVFSFGTTTNPEFVLSQARGSQASPTVISSGDSLGKVLFRGYDGDEFHVGAIISAEADAAVSNNDLPTRLVFSTTADGASSPTERMRIFSDGAVAINYLGLVANKSTCYLSGAAQGYAIDATSYQQAVAYMDRRSNDGTLIVFRQDGVDEGSISVSGTAVSYNGAHLSRWSQLPGGAIREEILRGSVLSNLDEMCDWGEEDNEQLNRMKVSDVEGDKNVSGVFQCWDDDDDTYTDDFYCAMTGDFIIRIAEGVTVERGDLLMSAGDGTAKPQDDDIIRSKTIAKVTSNHVTCTYDDGSYCVPCVLMAC